MKLPQHDGEEIYFAGAGEDDKHPQPPPPKGQRKRPLPREGGDRGWGVPALPLLPFSLLMCSAEWPVVPAHPPCPLPKTHTLLAFLCYQIGNQTAAH